MQYKVLNFEIFEPISGFFAGKTMTKEDRLKEMERKLNELAQDGWRVHQMSTSGIHDLVGDRVHTNGLYAYHVLVIMVKE